MSARRQLLSTAFALGAAVLVVGCQNEAAHDDNNMRNNNRSDSMNTGTGSMQRSSKDNRNMGVQTSERINDNSPDMNNGATASGGMSGGGMSGSGGTSGNMHSGSHASGGMNADTAGNTTGNMASSMQMPDQQFVKTVASSDMFEIESSQLAVERTKDASLKQFAQQMINDHTQTSTQLKGLAQQKGWTIPTSMTAEHQQQLTMLRNAQGDAFDAAYRTAQMRAHAEAIGLFDMASKNASDASLKTWAGQTLPKLQMHADMLKQMGTGSMNNMK